MPGKFVVSKAANGKLYFALKASNGETILASQMYASIEGVKKGVASVQVNCQKPEKFEKLVSKKGEPYFNLRAGNGQVVGKSEMYTTEKARDAGIASVVKHAPGAKLEKT
jgi:uncharacterized protein